MLLLIPGSNVAVFVVGSCGVGGGAGAGACGLHWDVVGFTRHPWPLLVARRTRQDKPFLFLRVSMYFLVFFFSYFLCVLLFCFHT